MQECGIRQGYRNSFVENRTCMSFSGIESRTKNRMNSSYEKLPSPSMSKSFMKSIASLVSACTPLDYTTVFHDCMQQA